MRVLFNFKGLKFGILVWFTLTTLPSWVHNRSYLISVRGRGGLKSFAKSWRQVFGNNFFEIAQAVGEREIFWFLLIFFLQMQHLRLLSYCASHNFFEILGIQNYVVRSQNSIAHDLFSFRLISSDFRKKLYGSSSSNLLLAKCWCWRRLREPESVSWPERSEIQNRQNESQSPWNLRMNGIAISCSRL